MAMAARLPVFLLLAAISIVYRLSTFNFCEGCWELYADPSVFVPSSEMVSSAASNVTSSDTTKSSKTESNTLSNITTDSSVEHNEESQPKKRLTRRERRRLIRRGEKPPGWLEIRRKNQNSKYGFQKTNPAAPLCHTLKDRNEVDFTLVIQTSHDRLWLMEEHCKRWGKDNPMSIAVAVEDVGGENATALKQQLQYLGCNVDKINISIWRNPGSDHDYPVNYLRNLALSGVHTSHAVLLDMDFLVSPNTFEQLQKHRDILLDLKTAIVIPAFALRPQCLLDDLDSDQCRKLHLSLMPESKTELLKMFINDSADANITQFRREFPRAHRATRYSDWRSQDDDELIPIHCPSNEVRYEPYLVVRFCRDAPPFQEAFAGYGENKRIWIRQLVRSGWKFFQVGGSFLVHLPHAKSASYTAWRAERGMGKQPKVTEIAENFMKWMSRTIPDETQTDYCKKTKMILS